MTDFKAGDRVLYIPTHAKSNRLHPDVETGTVTSVNQHGNVFVRYDLSAFRRGNPVDAPGIATRPEDLQPEMIEGEKLPKHYPVPPEHEVSCRSCGAAIVWGVTDAGKAVPLSVRRLRYNAENEPIAPSHFTDCPNAKQHSRKGAGN